MSRVALITGVTGQDGSILARDLLAKGYEVHGLIRRSSSPNTMRLEGMDGLNLHYGDMTDGLSLVRALRLVEPDEIYNLAAQSHVAVSFEVPEYTADTVALGATRLLEAVRLVGKPGVRFFQASSSEMFGDSPGPQDEATPFRPRSPYAIAKLHAFWSTVNYREAYGLFAANGIMFNHESFHRGEGFVTKKIAMAAVAKERGANEVLYLGNLNAKRDWASAHDMAHAMWLCLQHETSDDFVFASGETHSVRQFAEAAYARVGIALGWEGDGAGEAGICQTTGETVIKVDPALYRPTEVEFLLGSSSKARQALGWQPSIKFDGLVAEMVDAERARA